MAAVRLILRAGLLAVGGVLFAFVLIVLITILFGGGFGDRF
jgi:hypothetical protein